MRRRRHGRCGLRRAVVAAPLVTLALFGLAVPPAGADPTPAASTTGPVPSGTASTPPGSAATTPPVSTPPAGTPASPTPTATGPAGPANKGLPQGFAGQLQALHDQATVLQTNLTTAQTAASTAIAAYTATTKQVQAAVTAASQAQTALDTAQASASDARRQVQLVVRDSYVERIPHTSTALLLTGDFDDLQFSLSALNYLNGRNTDEFDRLNTAQTTAAALAANQEQMLAGARTLQTTADTQRAAALTALGQVTVQQAAFRTSVVTLREAAVSAASAAPLSAADAALYAAFLADLSALDTAVTASATTYVGGGPGLTPQPGTSWVAPVLTYRVSSCYCIRWGTFHHGVDLAAPLGTPIYAVGAGTVVAAGPAQGFGNWVVIDHHDGSFSIYGHERVLATVVGAQVSAGTLIAYVGSEGESSGPHLHFEVRLGSYASALSSTDPVLWLAQRGVSL